MVCFASQWIGIQSWVHRDSIHQCGADSAILNGWSEVISALGIDSGRITCHPEVTELLPSCRLLVQKDHVCEHKLAFQIEKGHIEGLRPTG